MLGALVGEAVGQGMATGHGATMPGTASAAYAMGALAVAAEGGWSMRGTLRVWAMHHDASADLPGLGPWAVHGDAYVPETGEGAPAFRPWTVVLPWLVPGPSPRATALMGLLHGAAGVHHQAGVAATRLVEARMSGAPADAVPGILARFPALAQGDPVADAVRVGAALGWEGAFDDAMARVRDMAPVPCRALAGFVAGAVAHAGTAGCLPGWCHMAALPMEEDVLAALGLFEKAAASRPRGAAWVGEPVPQPAGPASPGGMMARMLAGIRSGVAAFAPAGHPRGERH